ncbi:uncharacterized protein LOC123501111 [Portunus trituberculatus]|uniref:uncharacterized protein LOC123501111 n=1 Tax=Portunus trituberculatus TaxID=210409 RepID=UPI001E1D1A70|nr:uncharacterized protein LOC123501111 [Portunus trituberculatus]
MAAHPMRSQNLHSQAKEVFFNVREYFQNEKEIGSILDSITQVNRRTASAARVSETTMENINREGRENAENHAPKFTSPKKRQRSKPIAEDFFDNFNEGILHRTILRFYERKGIPTLEKILEEVKESIGYPGSRETLKRIGFRFAKHNGRKFLLERNDVQYARDRFLREMRKHLVDKHIIYLDETWVNQNYTVSKCWVTENAGQATGVRVPTGKGGRLIVLHAGSKEGFVPGAGLVFQAKNTGDYHDQMNAETFKKWFTNQLLPNIPPVSIFVIGNASYHSRKTPPTAADNKATIRQWLEEKGVAVPEVVFKTNLLHLVNQHVSCADTNYVVDKMASDNGHKVVRLPPYHYQYNPIELIWGQVKDCPYVAKINTFKLASLKPLIEESITRIRKENWKDAIKHAEKLQTEDTARDVVVDGYIDTLIITFTPDDEDSS